jgi:two-component system sensor histidine kinase HupT/HoxJ
MVSLTLINDGLPIPEEHMECLFEPFFTTKPEGAGLGLFVSYNIVRQHGGRLSAENLEDGQGVAFTIALPIAHPTGAEQGAEGSA